VDFIKRYKADCNSNLQDEFEGRLTYSFLEFHRTSRFQLFRLHKVPQRNIKANERQSYLNIDNQSIKFSYFYFQKVQGTAIIIPQKEIQLSI